MNKTKDELGDELCNYCPAKDMKMTQFSIGCEGNWCDSAYDNYLAEED